jgi:Tfp pilus assembly protein PilZ
LDVGTDVSLLLHLGNVEKELMLHGVVTWVHKGRPVGMGIRFVNMDPSSKELLFDALQ